MPRERLARVCSTNGWPGLPEGFPRDTRSNNGQPVALSHSVPCPTSPLTKSAPPSRLEDLTPPPSSRLAARFDRHTGHQGA
jgi:hypothetical protein